MRIPMTTRTAATADFTPEMKNTHVILAPDIFPMHMDLITGIFGMYGYRVEVLHDTGRRVIDTGLRYIHNDMCYPAVCAIGQQLYALTSGRYDPHKTALVQFQTGGGCRASNYIWMLRKALREMGMEYVPVVSLSLSRVEGSSGFRFTPMMLAKALMALVYGDLIMLLYNQVRPYEVTPGAARAAADKWNRELLEQFRHNRGLAGPGVARNMRSIAREFADIPRRKEKKTRVGIVGEIYVKYSPFGNNALEEFLASQDCEVMVPGVCGFFQYMFDNMLTDRELYGGGLKAALLGRTGARIARRLENKMLAVLKEFPEFIAPTGFEHLRRLGEKVIGRGVKMGEGWLLPAEIAELQELGYRNVVCAQPFGCLPNHIVAKGTVRTLREMYPQANICPIDFDAGASRVNQENRIKLMLAVAKENEL